MSSSWHSKLDTKCKLQSIKTDKDGVVETLK